MGPGAAYFVHNGSKSPDSLYIKYLNVTLHDLAQTGVDVTVGRFNYGSGTETLTGIEKIDWLKKVRLNARLIGGFEWSIYQRSFDGIRAGWTHDNGHLSFAAFRPTQGGFEASANKRIDNLDVVATAHTIRPGVIIPDAEIQFFNYYLDNSPWRPGNRGCVPAYSAAPAMTTLTSCSWKLPSCFNHALFPGKCSYRFSQ